MKITYQSIRETSSDFFFLFRNLKNVKLSCFCLRVIFTIILLNILLTTSYGSKIGYNQIRIENEYKLSIPTDKLNEVWAYLLNKYSSNPNLFLKKYDSSFFTRFSTELFHDVYFDTSDLALLKSKNGIRRRTRFIPEDTGNKKHGRSLLQIKLNHGNNLATNRSELKYPIDSRLKIGQGNEYGPIFLLKKKKHKNEFIERVTKINVDPLKLKETLILNQVRRRVYISNSEGPFATITLDEVSVEKWWLKTKFAEVELELNEVKYTDGNDSERQAMEKVNEILRNDLQSRFDYIKVDQEPKYNKAMDSLSSNSKVFELLSRYGLVF